jgi:uncharacterized protein DUF4962/heparinase II/III-like protein
MKLRWILNSLAFAPLAAQAALAACGGQHDFLVRSDPTLAPVRPQECSTLTQTPPEFTWPPQDGSNTYQVVVKFPDGRIESRSTTRNFILWGEPLPPGTYTWQVKVSGATKDASVPRTFTIAPEATPFVLPPAGSILVKARAAPRPRSWPHDATSPIAAINNERAKGFAQLLQAVENDEKRWFEDAPSSGSKNSNYDDTVEEHKRTVNEAFACAATKKVKYCENASRRLARQAAWSTSGPIGYANNDMASRTVAWTLALAYDWMFDYLSEQEKAMLRRVIRDRTEPMFQDMMSRYSKYPFDSHANITLNTVAAIGVLMAGDIPEADNWVKEAVPMAVAWTSPWGWSDGGFGNGTAQAFWDTGSNLPIWYILRNGAGVDLAKKEWVRNHGRFLAYFVPPGAPSGAFGDGLEMKLDELWSRIGEALAAFDPTPINRWYAKQHRGEDSSRMELMLAPRAAEHGGNGNGNGGKSPDFPDAAFFPSIGWAAMHSSLEDPNRTSIFFKSSPYGSYNHSHSDQNSFVVNARGRRLAIASGYYDDYGTRHWGEWYKQTKSANAITFDGGQGQGRSEKRFTGEIQRFGSRDGYDFAVGDAVTAYDGALTKAQRTIVYLRPNVVVIYDSLASKTPRTWEWNIHALNHIDKISERRVRLANSPAKMCVEMVAGPEVAFDQTDRFSVPPQGKNMPNQWHGTFATTAKSTSAEFVTVMRIGSDCKESKPLADVAHAGDAWAVKVDGKTVTLPLTN